MKIKTQVYYLKDETGKPKYVGKTGLTLKERLYAHIAESKRGKNKNRKCIWIRSMIENGYCPKIVLIEVVDGNGCMEEKLQIRRFLDRGFKLVNSTPGKPRSAETIFQKTIRLNLKWKKTLNFAEKFLKLGIKKPAIKVTVNGMEYEEFVKDAKQRGIFK